MKNKILLELKVVKDYVNNCMATMTDYINKLAEAVAQDTEGCNKAINDIEKRLEVIEKQLGIKQKKTKLPKIENAEEKVDLPKEGIKITAKKNKTEE